MNSWQLHHPHRALCRSFECTGFGKKKLGIRDPTVALPACNQSAVICLLPLLGAVQYVADCLSYRAALSRVQGHRALCCLSAFPSLTAKRPAGADRFV